MKDKLIVVCGVIGCILAAALGGYLNVKIISNVVREEIRQELELQQKSK